MVSQAVFQSRNAQIEFAKDKLEFVSSPDTLTIDIINSINILINLLSDTDNPEDEEIYKALIQAEKENSDLVKPLLINALAKKIDCSRTAEELYFSLQGLSLKNLSALSERELIREADDCYYSGQYRTALWLYKELSRRNPAGNSVSTKINRTQELYEVSKDFPKVITDIFHRALSLLNAGNTREAGKCLDEAIASAAKINLKFEKAEKLKKHLEGATESFEFRRNAERALDKGNWEEAIGFLEVSLSYYNDEITRKLLNAAQVYLHLSDDIRLLENSKNNLTIKAPDLVSIKSDLDANLGISNPPLLALREQLVEKWQVLADAATAQLLNQAETFYKLALEYPASLERKLELYQKAIQLYEDIHKLNPSLSYQNYVNSVSMADYISREITKIKSLKEKKRFPKGMPRDDVFQLRKIARLDPDVAVLISWQRNLVRTPKYMAVVFGFLTAIMLIMAFLPLSFSPLFISIGVLFGAATITCLIIMFYLLEQHQPESIMPNLDKKS